MKNVSLLVTAVVTSAVFAAPLHAQTAKEVGSCSEVHWKDPRSAQSCIAVVERNGKRYVKLSGKVIRKGKISLTVLLDKSKEELTWMPDLGETVVIDGKETDPMTVAIGQQLRFYVPEAQIEAQ